MALNEQNDFSKVLQHTFDVGLVEAKEISAFFVEEQLARGDFFLKAGQRATKLSFIQSGIVRVFAYADNKEVTQWIGEAGYLMTDLAAFELGTAARWYIQALTDVKMLSLSKTDYLAFERNIPEWNMLQKRFMTKCFIMLENRVFDFISLTAEERYKRYFEQHKTLLNQVPLQYIASMLGMTPETLSRIRAKTNS